MFVRFNHICARWRHRSLVRGYVSWLVRFPSGWSLVSIIYCKMIYLLTKSLSFSDILLQWLAWLELGSLIVYACVCVFLSFNYYCSLSFPIFAQLIKPNVFVCVCVWLCVLYVRRMHPSSWISEYTEDRQSVFSNVLLCPENYTMCIKTVLLM